MLNRGFAGRCASGSGICWNWYVGGGIGKVYSEGSQLTAGPGAGPVAVGEVREPWNIGTNGGSGGGRPIIGV